MLISSYRFIPILSKLQKHFGDGLKICMWFGFNPQIVFLQVELSHFSSIIYNKVNGQGIACGRKSSYIFTPNFSKLHWCLGHGLKISLRFGYNPQNFFLLLCSQVGLSHFTGIIYNKGNGQEYLVGATPPTVFTDSFETSLVFGLNIFIHNSVKIHTHKKVQHNERI